MKSPAITRVTGVYPTPLTNEITKERIEAYVNYLINQKHIYRLFSLGKDNIYQLDDMINIFSNVEVLLSQGNIKKVIGPFDADINTIYRVNFEKNDIIKNIITLLFNSEKRVDIFIKRIH